MTISVHTPDEFNISPSLSELVETNPTTHPHLHWGDRPMNINMVVSNPAHMTFDVVGGGMLGTNVGEETQLEVTFTGQTELGMVNDPAPNVKQMIAYAYSDLFGDTDVVGWESLDSKYNDAELMLPGVFTQLTNCTTVMYGGSTEPILITHISRDGPCDIMFHSGPELTSPTHPAMMPHEKFIDVIMRTIFHESATTGSSVGQTAGNEVELHIKNRINVSDGNVATYEKYHMMSNMNVSYGAFMPAEGGGGGDGGEGGDGGDGVVEPMGDIPTDFSM